MVAPKDQPPAEPDPETLYKRALAFFNLHLKK
jgi:hypothetical protein